MDGGVRDLSKGDGNLYAFFVESRSAASDPCRSRGGRFTTAIEQHEDPISHEGAKHGYFMRRLESLVA
jgi:hypothetical protein